MKILFICGSLIHHPENQNLFSAVLPSHFSSFQLCRPPHRASGGRMMLARLAFLLMALLSPVSAAPATTATPKKSTSAVQPAAAPIKAITPSRLIGKEEMPAYIASISASFSMRDRETDPFGQLQDPDAKPIVKAPVIKATRSSAAVQATPFSDIVNLIKVTTIMPREKRFLIGTRSVKEGDRIPLVYRGRTINISVVSVSSNQIQMQNVESGESAALKMSLLPEGMVPGNQKIATPGMVRDSANAPLDLGGSSSATEENSNR